jgi:putative transcriptional regulator
MNSNRYCSLILATVHETAEDPHAADVMPHQTLREFDELFLTPVIELTADDISSLHRREGISQAVFATHLNITVGLVSQWQRGEKHPRGASLKLLTLVKEKGLSAIA